MKTQYRSRRGVRARTLLIASLVALLPAAITDLRAENGIVQEPNYELASRWTSPKIAKMVFDTAVTPHWLESNDRFWYSYETRNGKRYFIVDPLRRTRSPLFENAKMAAMLTSATLVPMDAQHLPIKSLKVVKQDSTLRLEIEVPKDAEIPGLKKPVTTTTTQSEGKAPAGDDDVDGPQQRRGTGAADDQEGEGGKKSVGFEVRRDERKVKDLWVINSLSTPRPTLETYRYAMPGEPNIPQPQIELFDVASKARVNVKADRFRDQSLQIATAPASGIGREKEKTEPRWLSETSDKLSDDRRHRRQRAPGEHPQNGRRADQSAQAIRLLRAARAAAQLPGGG